MGKLTFYDEMLILKRRPLKKHFTESSRDCNNFSGAKFGKTCKIEMLFGLGIMLLEVYPWSELLV